MKYLFQFLVIITFSLLGEILNWLIPLPIPASIYGIILLFIALELKIVKVRQIKEISSFLILIMPLMFVPPAAGLIDAWDDVKDNWMEYVFITVTTTFIVMAVAGWVTQRVASPPALTHTPMLSTSDFPRREGSRRLIISEYVSAGRRQGEQSCENPNERMINPS